MAIVINNMKSLPDRCGECPMNNMESSYCQGDECKRSTFEWRPFWCPLSERDENFKNDTDTIKSNMYKR